MEAETLPEPVTKGLKALSNPVRQAIILYLMKFKRGRTYKQIYQHIRDSLNIKRTGAGTLEYHLGTLYEAGLIECVIQSEKGRIVKRYRATELSEKLLEAILKVYMGSAECPTR